MKRIDKVYQGLMTKWQAATKEEVLAKQGSAAKELAAELGLTRANTSLELNKLVRQAQVVKIKTFPVRYLPMIVIEQHFGLKHLDYYEVASLKDLTKKPTEPAVKPEQLAQAAASTQVNQVDPLESMIGYRGSLHNAVSQAKAALMYPPHGLHMMLLGQTGVGKTYFANKIYAYAKFAQILKEDAPFVSFNCADYYNNPQLLMATLFGHAKGAYTGADQEKAGLVEQANGGILLLDEVHRLPPEGQEMLFYFIDNGVFNRLGESQKKRHAQVLIICATTENPDSAMLATFLRRIPMSITIPALDERPITERIELAHFLFQTETKRIKRVLSVKRSVFEIILNEDNYGNVGQLKSQIQLTCAQAFLNSMGEKTTISVTDNDLPEKLRQSWLAVSRAERKQSDLSRYLKSQILIEVGQPSLDKLDNEENIYSTIETKVHKLRAEGINEKEIHQYIMTDLHLHIKNFFKQEINEENFSKFVDPAAIKLAEKLKLIAEEEMDLRFDASFIHYFSLHLDAFFKRGGKNDLLMSAEIENIKREHGLEYQVAKLFQTEILKETGTAIPDIEVIYLTMLLTSIESMSATKKIGLLVVAHGNSTATSMVNVATELLGKGNIDALDMPLTVSPSTIYEQMKTKVRELNQGKGVLLLVDMGSLGMFTQKLATETGIPVRAVQNVTTSIILEALRKVNYIDMDLNSLANQLRRDFIKNFAVQEKSTGKKRAIVSICMTGSGTALKLKKLIEGIIRKTTTENIEVKTVSALKMSESIPPLAKEYELIATVGTKEPSVAVPFISLEDLIASNGEARLEAIIRQQTPPAKEKQSQSNVVVSQMCEDILNEHLVYLNPRPVNQMLQNWLEDLSRRLKLEMSNSQQIACIVHTAFALERASHHQTSLNYDETPSPELLELLPVVKQTLDHAVSSLKLTLPQDEYYFIAETVIDNQR